MQRGAAAAIQECSGGAVRALPGGEISQQAGMGQRRQHISHRSPRTHDPPTLCPPTLLSPRGGLGGADRPHPRHGRAASRAPSWKRGCSKDKGGSRVLYGLMTPPPSNGHAGVTTKGHLAQSWALPQLHHPRNHAASRGNAPRLVPSPKERAREERGCGAGGWSPTLTLLVTPPASPSPCRRQ